MQPGTVISGAGHLALMAFAFFGLPDFRRDVEVEPMQVTDVSIVSLSDFQAAQSAAPDAPATTDVSMDAPQTDTPDVETPSPSEAPTSKPAAQPQTPPQDVAPDVTALDVASPDVSVAVEAPNAETNAGAVGLETPLPDAAPQDGSINSSQTAMLAPERPNLAPRIDTSAAPKPPQPVPDAPQAAPERTPETAPEAPPVEDTPAAAPQEATTEIAPDAEVQDNPATPRAAARPRGRPDTLAADAEQRRKEAEAVEAAIKAAAAASEADTTPTQPETAPAAPETPTPQTSRIGTDFNSAQKQAIGDVIGRRWNKTLLEGKDNYQSLVVVVRVKLNTDGKVIGAVEPVEPANPSGDFEVAYQAARRAVLQAQPLPLPRDKFRDGDYLEIRFDPSRSAISLD